MIYYFNFGVQFHAPIDSGLWSHPIRWLAHRPTHSQARVLGDYTYYQRSKNYKIWALDESL